MSPCPTCTLGHSCLRPMSLPSSSCSVGADLSWKMRKHLVLVEDENDLGEAGTDPRLT